MRTYYELWNILWNWKSEFTVREFSSTFPSPDPNKVLHDMAERWFLKRAGWGRYHVNSPREYLARSHNIPRAYEMLNEAHNDYAFVGPDAVFLWTKGGYQVDRFFGFYPIHLKVKKNDLDEWKTFFKSKGRRIYVKGEPLRKTLFGLFYTLYPEVDFETENVEGYPVVPLKDTVDYCMRMIYSYEPALEMLDKMYNLDVKIEYKETRTNFGVMK